MGYDLCATCASKGENKKKKSFQNRFPEHSLVSPHRKSLPKPTSLVEPMLLYPQSIHTALLLMLVIETYIFFFPMLVHSVFTNVNNYNQCWVVTHYK